MIRRIAPYGSWKSPVTPELLVQQAVGLSAVSVHDGVAYWVESRPGEGGRQVLISAPLALPGAPPEEVTPHGFSVRSQVHEYGGRCYAVQGTTVVFSNWEDQRLWVIRPGSGVDGDAVEPPRPLTAMPALPCGVRFADPVIDPTGTWVVCVRESHRREGQVDNDLVAVALAGELVGSDPVVLADGHDFFAAPRLSPDGTRLAWISWDQPAMPWDGTTLRVAGISFDPEGVRIDQGTVLAGGAEESVTQPRWSPAGVLHYVSDRTGWWNIYDEHGRPLAPAEAEFAAPDWTFGNCSYGFEPSGGLVATWAGPEGVGLGRLSRSGSTAGTFEPMAFPYSSYSSVTPIEGGALVIAASPVTAAAVVRLGWIGEAVEVLRDSRPATLAPGSLSAPEQIQFPTGSGDIAYAWFYPPTNEDFEAPAGERPPLVVTIHGGPTSSAQPTLNLGVQFWTSRGFAVADVDYRGSSGYGRAYRRKLDGAWGVVDVEDCAAAVAELDRRGLADGRRAVIRGGSAGGFTTLAALAFTDRFAAGASHYGVADLELLARDTHKFEARYLDGLVAPWPDGVDVYRSRSPIHHIEDIASPLILFQGLEDRIVPPEQSELMYRALAARGVPVAYMAFDGEQHGFRRAETIKAVIAAELEFYATVLGFDTDPPGTVPLEIANERAVRPVS